MIFLWLLAGTLLVSVPFYFFYTPYDLWPSVVAGGAGAAVYFLVLLTHTIRTMKAGNIRLLTGFFGVMVPALCVFGWKTLDDMSHFQHTTLNKIRTVIGEGMFLSEDISERAMPVFAQYKKQKSGERGVVTIFKALHGKKLKGEMFPTEYPESDPGKRFVRFFGDTMVVLTSVDTVAKGMNAEFANANGSTGRVQTATTITAEGVVYEREN